jgi:hypothetical protein
LISGLAFSGAQVLLSKRAEFKNTQKKSILKSKWENALQKKRGSSEEAPLSFLF